MRKLSFLLVFLLFSATELFQWDDLTRSPQVLTHNLSTDAVAALNNAGDDLSMTPASAIDLSTVILLGCGLVGLVGLGRKKTDRDPMES